MKAKNRITDIAELLPDDLNEAVASKIVDLVAETIESEVNNRVSLLESKTKAFIRTKVDAVKEYALAELTEESDTYRDAQRFQAVKTLMALELGSEDSDSAVSQVSEQNGDLEQENTVLLEELTNAVTRVKNLEAQAKILSTKATKLEESNTLLEAEVATLEEGQMNLTEDSVNESAASRFNSETAVVLSKADGNLRLTNESNTDVETKLDKGLNPLLTEEMLDITFDQD